MLHARDRPGRLRPSLLLLAVAVALGSAACGGGSDNADAAPQDYTIPDVTFGDIPPGCADGIPNEKGVGATCTMGGGECKRYGSAVCSCDPLGPYKLPDGSPCICIIPILGMTCDVIPTDYCGTNASCCSYLTVGSACLPNACLDMLMCPVF